MKISESRFHSMDDDEIEERFDLLAKRWKKKYNIHVVKNRKDRVYTVNGIIAGIQVSAQMKYTSSKVEFVVDVPFLIAPLARMYMQERLAEAGL